MKTLILEFVDGKTKSFTLTSDEANRIIMALDSQIAWMKIKNYQFSPKYLISLTLEDNP